MLASASAPKPGPISWTAFADYELQHLGIRCAAMAGSPILDAFLTILRNNAPPFDPSFHPPLQEGLNWILARRELPTVTVCNLRAREDLLFPVFPDDTIARLKTRIVQVWGAQFPSPAVVQIISHGKLLRDDERVTSFEKVHVISRPTPPARHT